MNPDYISTDPIAKKIIFLLTMATRTVPDFLWSGPGIEYHGFSGPKFGFLNPVAKKIAS